MKKKNHTFQNEELPSAARECDDEDTLKKANHQMGKEIDRSKAVLICQLHLYILSVQASSLHAKCTSCNAVTISWRKY